MKKILLLGSVVSPCPPQYQGGTERVAYYQAKQLAKRDMSLIFVGAEGTANNFKEQLSFEKEKETKRIIKNIEFIEIGGGTGFGTQADALKFDLSQIEASRKLRIEMTNLARVQQLMINRQKEYSLILNNMRGEATFFPLAKKLNKPFINVMHLNIFPQLAELLLKYQIKVITISNNQKKEFPNLDYLSTIYNPINTKTLSFNPQPKNYALMVSTIGYHKNQQEAILACRQARIPLVLAGKIRDQKYFDEQIKPYIDKKNLTYYGEMSFNKKLKLYQQARVFLFPIKWQEPFGLVVIEALACGTPIIAYPHGGPKEIVKDGKTGFLVNNINEMAQKISQINLIKREICRQDAEKRFDEKIIGDQYFKTINNEISYLH